eukprot:Sspe_Gene.48329::Locus_25083_Transcript_1_1_Confidence_1.000_Length_702::g.48329::m.48329
MATMPEPGALRFRHTTALKSRAWMENVAKELSAKFGRRGPAARPAFIPIIPTPPPSRSTRSSSKCSSSHTCSCSCSCSCSSRCPTSTSFHSSCSQCCDLPSLSSSKASSRSRRLEALQEELSRVEDRVRRLDQDIKDDHVEERSLRHSISELRTQLLRMTPKPPSSRNLPPTPGVAFNAHPRSQRRINPEKLQQGSVFIG